MAATPGDAYANGRALVETLRNILMIDLYYWTTPNGHKLTMMLEETGTPYKIFPVNIGKGEQFKAEFLAISPNNRIPAMVDHDPPGGGKPLRPPGGAKSRSRSSSPAPFWSISPRRPENSCRPSRAPAPTSCSGCSG